MLGKHLYFNRSNLIQAMSFSITNQRTQSCFTTQPGETILEAALRDNRIFPYGCRNGVCGACKSTLVSGTVDYGTYDDFALTDDEIKQGKVLLCQAIAHTDVTIDAEEIASGQNIQIKMLPCRVAQLEKRADDVMRVFLQLPKSQSFNFMPGQYIDIIMKDGQRRSFSIANLPQHAAEEGLELHIRHVADGHFTSKIFTSLRPRDLLRFEGPFGTYLLQSEAEQPMIMVAGGTGFAPIKSLVLQALDSHPTQRIHLFWGARDEQDLYLNELAEKWAREYANFRYTPVLSGAVSQNTALDGWRGASGWVHEVVLASYDSFAEFDVYASGPPVMIDAVRDGMCKMGMRLERFFFDSFTYAPQE